MVLDYNTELEILLFDQNKIVTYKQLTNKFDLTPDEAKNLMQKFYKTFKSNSKRKDAQVLATYLLIGMRDSKKQIQLVNEIDLDAKSKDLKILSKQIYSLETAEIEDFNLFYSNDVDVSNNIERKSNTDVVYKSLNATTLKETSNAMVVDDDMDDMAMVQAEQSSNKAKKPSENIMSAKNISSASSFTTNKQQIKDEPKENQPKTNANETSKKLKLDDEKKEEEKGETNKTLVKQASSSQTTAAVKKPDPKKPAKAANQATLMNFFKKA